MVKHIPEDVLRLILQAAYEERGPAFLQAALRVNHTFYLLAATMLYSCPTIRELRSFLLGADRPVPPRILAMEPGRETDLLHVQHGNTKLPLLRHLRHIITPVAEIAPDEIYSWEDPDRKPIVRSLEEAGRSVERIIKSLKSDTTHSMTSLLPHFQYIALDALPFTVAAKSFTGDFIPITDEVKRVNATCLPALLSAGPLRKSVCCSDAQSLPSALENDWLNGSRDTLPDLLCWHTGLQQPFGIAWGSTTRVYVNSPRRRDR
ncbi:hypothetical protein IAT38_007316 [Cryptococcus sp. DSM 104549]